MTTKNTCCLLILVAVATAVICASTVVCSSAPSPAPVDPYRPCPWGRVLDPEDPFYQKLGSWAVDQQHIPMHFKKVESAMWQGVAGQCTISSTHNYYYELIIDASIRGSPDDQRYRAVVCMVNFNHPQKVVSFSAIPSRNHPPAAAPAQF